MYSLCEYHDLGVRMLALNRVEYRARVSLTMLIWMLEARWL
jgi:hypothetical protein